MKASLVALTAFTAFPVIASAEPYVVARLGYAQTDIPLGAPYNGIVHDNAPVLGLDVGLGFDDKWAAEFGYSTYGSLDGLATPCAPGLVCTTTEVSGNDQDVIDVALEAKRFDDNVSQISVGFGWGLGRNERDVNEASC